MLDVLEGIWQWCWSMAWALPLWCWSKAPWGREPSSGESEVKVQLWSISITFKNRRQKG